MLDEDLGLGPLHHAPAGKTERVKQVIVERIRSGAYPVGARLPGVRSVAEEFGVHANTVSRVYGELADEGLVRTVRGSGTFVVDVPGEAQANQAMAELSASLYSLALQARRLGLSREAWARLVTEAEAEGFRADGPTMWFVECSPRDTEELAASLCTLLEGRVRPLLTTDLRRRTSDFVEEGQLFITTPFHFEEVQAEVGADHQVVNVNVVPTSDTLVRLARLAPDAALTIVASNTATLSRFVAMVRTYMRVEPVAMALAHEPEAQELVRRAEVLIDSQSIHDKVMDWGPSGEVITVRYQIEPTSVAYLRELLRVRGLD